ncbi:hypothetical protein [Roseateles microcysteis]|uniref:hypothetical protein n=1 Tax=Roseateles microcysteis TaxID=3119057 RepID=UPI002FE664EF
MASNSRPPSDWQPTPRQMELLFAELGLCLNVYQRIELQLKALLPFLVDPRTGRTYLRNGNLNWRIFIDSKETLGGLMKRLHEKTTAERLDEFESYWRTLVDYRNEVVHHFMEQPFSNLETAEKYSAARDFLVARRLHALPMHDSLDVAVAKLSKDLSSGSSGAA